MKAILFGTLSVDKFNANTKAQFFFWHCKNLKFKALVEALLRQEPPDYFLNVMCRGNQSK